MDIATLAPTIGSGLLAAVAYQSGKGEWNKWLTLAGAIATAFAVGYFPSASNPQVGIANGLIAALAAISTHSAALDGTPLGSALKLALAPRSLKLVSQLALQLASAIENKPPLPPAA